MTNCRKIKLIVGMGQFLEVRNCRKVKLIVGMGQLAKFVCVDSLGIILSPVIMLLPPSSYGGGEHLHKWNSYLYVLLSGI